MQSPCLQLACFVPVYISEYGKAILEEVPKNLFQADNMSNEAKMPFSYRKCFQRYKRELEIVTKALR